MNLFLIICSRCQQETGLATTNKNVLAEMTYKCEKCQHTGKGIDNYQEIDRDKYLEGFELIEREEPNTK